MPDFAEHISPDRLFAAIEAIYRANEAMSPDGGISVYPPRLMGTARQPAEFRAFTVHEIEEASHFLVRMGLIVADDGTAPEEDRRCA